MPGGSLDVVQLSVKHTNSSGTLLSSSLLSPLVSTETFCLQEPREKALARVVQRLDNTIHRINHYPADSVVCFVNIYKLDSDLSGG